MTTRRDKIIKKVIEILNENPQGVKYSQLFNYLKEEFPNFPKGTIHGTIWNLEKRRDDIVKPERGLFVLKKFFKEEYPLEKIERIKEECFYQPFADYLINDLEECTKAIPLGKNKFQDKWGTPDVIGIYKFLETEPIRPPIEIISAEIKIDTQALITAFGQVCSYKLFSHKAYLVIPNDSPQQDIGRLESLCLKFSIGLITFNRRDIENPDFRIITRAIKHEPDYFYVNKYLKLLGKEIEKLF